MRSSTATSTGEVTAAWLAGLFAEIERKDMRVVEVRVRSVGIFEERFAGYAIESARGRRYVWKARLVEDRTMKKGVVTLRYERVVDPSPKPAVVVHSRSRTIR